MVTNIILVIYADGKVPEYKKINTLTAGETFTFDPDIQLGVAPTKNVIGDVMITGGDNLNNLLR